MECCTAAKNKDGFIFGTVSSILNMVETEIKID
jgi:hypothetical protein